MGTEHVYLVPKLTPVEGDHVVLSPVWLVPAETFSRGMLKRPAYKYITVVLDAMTGSTLMLFEGSMPWSETAEHPDVKTLPPVVDRSRASFLAERSLENTRNQGWKSIGTFSSVHVDPEKAQLRWRLIVLKAGIPLDGLTGEPLRGSELLSALLTETMKDRKGGSR